MAPAQIPEKTWLFQSRGKLCVSWSSFKGSDINHTTDLIGLVGTVLQTGSVYDGWHSDRQCSALPPNTISGGVPIRTPCPRGLLELSRLQSKLRKPLVRAVSLCQQAPAADPAPAGEPSRQMPEERSQGSSTGNVDTVSHCDSNLARETPVAAGMFIPVFWQDDDTQLCLNEANRRIPIRSPAHHTAPLCENHLLLHTLHMASI